MTGSLVVQVGEDSSVFHDRFVVGREGDLVVDDLLVSKQHAVFVKFSAGWGVEDLGSMNGTFVNGQRLWGHHWIERGDKLRVGRTMLTLVPT